MMGQRMGPRSVTRPASCSVSVGVGCPIVSDWPCRQSLALSVNVQQQQGHSGAASRSWSCTPAQGCYHEFPLVAGHLAEDVLSCFDLLVRELPSDFTSAGTLCRGWLYLPEGVTRPPVIVLAHGISLTHSFHYWRRAEAYAAAGFAVFDFDPRFIGCSDGEPRQMVSVRCQREDLAAAVAHVRSLETVDASRVVLAGMSLGGGLVIDVAARDHSIAAVVAIVPYLDGTKALPGTPLSEQLRFIRAAFADRTRRLIGKEPVLTPVFGKAGDATTLLSRDGAWELLPTVGPADAVWDSGFTSMSSSAGDYRNQVTTWEVLGSLVYRPGKRLKDVSCPVLLVSGDADTVTPATSQRPWAQGRDNVTIRTGPFNHFDPFSRDSEASIAADVAFLRLHVE